MAIITKKHFEYYLEDILDMSILIDAFENTFHVKAREDIHVLFIKKDNSNSLNEKTNSFSIKRLCKQNKFNYNKNIKRRFFRKKNY